MTPQNWRALKQGSSKIQVHVYKSVIKSLKNNERMVFGTTVPSKSKTAHRKKHGGLVSPQEMLKIAHQKAAQNRTHRPHKAVQQKRNQITQIQPQKHNRRRYNIFIDNQYAFPASEATIVHFYLRRGLVITSSLKSKIKHVDAINQVRDMAVRYLDRQPYTSKDLENHLYRRLPKTSPKLIQKTITWLEQVGLLNDKQYCAEYIRDVLGVQQKGPGYIKRKLMQKGIPDGMLTKILYKYYTPQKQLHNATALAKQTFQANPNLSFRKRITKIKITLMRRGFNADITTQAISECDFHPNEKKQADLLQRDTQQAIRQYHHRYSSHYKNVIKAKQFLLRRGFSFDDIDMVADTLDAKL